MYNLAFRKQMPELAESGLMLKFHRIYCVSLNELITYLLASGTAVFVSSPW